MKINFKKLLPHAFAIGIFLILSSIYFSPLFNGYKLKQSDIKQFQGVSNEIVNYRLQNDKEPLWTNSMFSGMPAYQVSVLHENNYLLQLDQLIKLGLPRPVGLLFIAMLGFYIFALCLRINPWLGIMGAIGFGFSTINILYLGAGHMSKVNSIAYMAPALGGLILAFREKIMLGAAIFALFFGLNITANHLQITYYLLYLLAAVSIEEVIRLIIQKKYKHLFQVVGMLIVALFLAVSPSASNLVSTQEYSKYTTRGATDLTIVPKDKKADQIVQQGLTKDYILEYNYGKGELLSIIAPNTKGAKDDYIGNDEDIMANVDYNYSQQVSKMNRYWGGQRMSGGAFYFGVLMIVFAIFGLFFLKDSIKWPFLTIAILALLLSSNNQGGINDFFINKVPLYNKFRDSKMILVLIQVMLPALGVLFLDKFFKKDGIIGNSKSWLIASGLIIISIIILYTAPTLSGNFLRTDEMNQFSQALNSTKDPQQITFIEGLKAELIKTRVHIYQSDMGRAIFLVILGCGFILLATYTKISAVVLSLIGIVIVSADNISISKRYLNNEDLEVNYEDNAENVIPFLPEKADYSILENEKNSVPSFNDKVNELYQNMEESSMYKNAENSEDLKTLATFGVLELNSNFRVLNFNNPFNETKTSFFHKSIGGYHGAKLKRYQELIDFYIGDEMQQINQEIASAKNAKLQEYAFNSPSLITNDNAKSIFDTIQVNEVSLSSKVHVLNMLNTKYIIVNNSTNAVKNTNSNGNAWFVQNIKSVQTTNDEMLSLGNENLKNVAVVHKEFSNIPKSISGKDTSAFIQLTNYGTNYMKYQSVSKVKLPAVFSEIYYPKGWNCYIDGNLTESFRADYILRAAMIPAGKHIIEWKFEPKSFKTASAFSLVGSLLLFLSVLTVFGFSIKEIRSRTTPHA